MTITNEFLRGVQVLVLEEMESNSVESFYKDICKWYSKTYFTPLLSVIEEIDPEHVVRTFYEDRFEGLSSSEDEAMQQEWDRLKNMLTMEDKELAEFLTSEEEEESGDQEWIKELLAVNKQETVEIPKVEMSEQEQEIFDKELNFSLSEGDDDDDVHEE